MLWYLATPYTKYADGLEGAFRDACRASARLLQAGYTTYSPIAHTHPIAIYGGLDPIDHDLWLEFDRKMMDAADGLIIVEMDGWQESRGITVERDEFRRVEKPIRYLNWPTMTTLSNGWTVKQ